MPCAHIPISLRSPSTVRSMATQKTVTRRTARVEDEHTAVRPTIMCHVACCAAVWCAPGSIVFISR
jgi:hypothetical protein